jgi:hypothetical protein
MRYCFVRTKFSNKKLQEYACYFAVILSACNKRKADEEFSIKFYIAGKPGFAQSAP